MSVREEDKQKNCTNRGLGLAAAAIGVGVGAALYYFFNKRPENPDTEGSTSQDWTCERPQTLNMSISSEDSYTTLSEHSTTDTSIHNSSIFSNLHSNSMVTEEDSDDSNDTTASDDSESSDFERDYESDEEITSNWENSWLETMLSSRIHTRQTESLVSDSDMDNEWDVTHSSIDVPRATTSGITDLFSRITNFVAPSPSPTRYPRSSEEEQIRIIREQAFRERRWSLEECSICFEIMLKDQELVSLPCTHNFHVQCIGPWLQEHHTCPMCRTAAE